MKNPAKLQFNMRSDIGDAAESIPATIRRSRFQGAYGLAVSSLALLALSSNLCLAYASNLVMLDSEYLGDGIFEYRLTCNLQPCLERSGLSNFSLSFPGFDGVVQEAVNWQRGPGFPTPPQAEASLCGYIIKPIGRVCRINVPSGCELKSPLFDLEPPNPRRCCIGTIGLNRRAIAPMSRNA